MNMLQACASFRIGRLSLRTDAWLADWWDGLWTATRIGCSLSKDVQKFKGYISLKTMKLVVPQKVIPGNWTNEAPKYPFIHLSLKSTFVFSSFEYVWL